MAALGGYQQWHVGTDTDLSQLQHGSWVTLQAFLELFGANVFGTSYFGANPAIEVVFVSLHLAGAIAVVCALGVAIRAVLPRRELIVPTFAVAIVLNLAAYMISTHAQDLLGAREIAAVLPLGAVLAGRVLGDRVLAWTRTAKAWFVPVLAVVTAGYLAALGYGAAQAAVPAANEPLAAWLAAHRLSAGLATYWQANSTTLDSGGRIRAQRGHSRLRRRARALPVGDRRRELQPVPALRELRRGGGPSALPGMQDAARAHLRPPGPGLSRTTATSSWSGTRTCWPRSGNPAPRGPEVTCTGCGAWPPPAAPERRRRRSGRGSARTGSAAAWRTAAPAPSGRAR